MDENDQKIAAEMDAAIVAVLYDADGCSRADSGIMLDIVLAAGARVVCNVADQIASADAGDAGTIAEELVRKFSEKMRRNVAAAYKGLAAAKH